MDSSKECNCEHKDNLLNENLVFCCQGKNSPVSLRISENKDNSNSKEYKCEHPDNPLPDDNLCCSLVPIKIDAKIENEESTDCKEYIQENPALVENSCCCKSASPVPSRIASSADLSSIASFPEYDLNSNLTLDVLRNRLADLVKNKGSDLIQACKNFDRRSTYKIHKTQLRQVLRTFCFPITAAQFDELMKEVNGHSNEKINYITFFKQFSGVKDIPINKKSKKIENIPVDEVELRIKKKIQPILRDIIRSFWLFDINKDGLIQKAELRRIIKNYCFDLSDQLFEELWKLHDPKVIGVIDYKQFLLKLGINAERYQTFMPPETVAQALYWSDEKSRNVDDKSEPGKPDCLKLVQHIKNNVLNPVAELRALFSRMNCNDKFDVTREEFRKILEAELEIHISEDEFNELTDFLDSSDNNTINCANFLKLFDCPYREDDSKSTGSRCNEECLANKYMCLQGDKLKFKLKHHFNKHIKDIKKAILVFDPHQSGFIEPVKLKTILSRVCFPLTDDQFEEIVSGFKTYRGSLNYGEFLRSYRKEFGEDTKKWVATINKLADYKSRCPPDLPLDEVEEMLKECVQSRKTAMLKDFKLLDFCNVGIISKDDVRNVFNKFAYRFNDKQFEALWKKLPRNKFNQLLYEKFLEEYSLEKRHENKNCTGGFSGIVKANISMEKPGLCEMHPVATKQKRSSKSRQNTKEIILSEAPHLRKIFNLMETAIVRDVRTIRYHLNRADPKQTGYVNFAVLTNVLAKYGIRLTAEDEFHILDYFDNSLSGKINYKEFLKIFVWHA